MHRLHSRLILGSLLGAFCFMALSGKAQQVIHIENRRMAQPEDGFSGDISFQANLVQNFNNTFQTNNLFQLYYNRGRHRVMSISALNLTIFNEERIRNDGFQHLRYNFKARKRWSPEVFAQYQYNEWLKIDFRALHGAGARMTVLNNDSSRTKLFAGLSYMHEYEEETTGRIVRAHRANLYLSVGFPIGKIAYFDAIGYLQPNITRIADTRTSLQFNIDVQITERLSLLIVHNVVYDGAPPEGLRNTFYNLRNGLRYRF